MRRQQSTPNLSVPTVQEIAVALHSYIERHILSKAHPLEGSRVHFPEWVWSLHERRRTWSQGHSTQLTRVKEVENVNSCANCWSSCTLHVIKCALPVHCIISLCSCTATDSGFCLIQTTNPVQLNVHAVSFNNRWIIRNADHQRTCFHTVAYDLVLFALCCCRFTYWIVGLFPSVLDGANRHVFTILHVHNDNSFVRQ